MRRYQDEEFSKNDKTPEAFGFRGFIDREGFGP